MGNKVVLIFSGIFLLVTLFGYVFASKRGAGIAPTQMAVSGTTKPTQASEQRHEGEKFPKIIQAHNPSIQYVHGYAGKKYPPEWIQHPALIEGYTVLQLTTSKAEDSKFYLTTESYFPDLNAVAFVSNRTGVWNIFYCDLSTGEITQVTDFPPEVIGNGHGSVCSFTTNEVIYFYNPDSSLRRVNLLTYKDTELYRLPEGYDKGNSMTTNGDGTIVGITAIKGEKGDVEASKMIFVGIGGRVVKEVTRVGQELSHVNLNTAGAVPGVIYARKEIPERKRFYYMSLDGKVDELVAGERTDREGVSHPFWMPNGSKVCYLHSMKYEHTQNWLGLYDVATGKKVEYAKVKDVDMDVNHDGTLFVGSGKEKDEWLKFWSIEGDTLLPTKIFKHNAKFQGKEIHDVHNTFIRGTNNVIFNSDGEGNGNVYVLMEQSR